MDLYFLAPDAGGNSLLIVYEFFNAGVAVDYSFIILVPSAGASFEDLRQITIAAATAYATLHSYTVTNPQRYYPNPATSTVEGIMSASDKAKLDGLAPVAITGDYNDLSNKPSIPSMARTTSALSLSLVGTGATGTQISSTKDSSVRLNVSTSTTATIGGASTSTVTLKKCATNDSTEGNWTTIAVLENSQTISLAVVLQSAQVVKGQLVTDLPSGWYVKLVNTGSGTHTESFLNGEKTIFG